MSVHGRKSPGLAVGVSRWSFLPQAVPPCAYIPSLLALSKTCSFLCPPFSLFWLFLTPQACCRISHLKMSPSSFIPHRLSPHFSAPFDSKTRYELCTSPAFTSSPPEPTLSNQTSISAPLKRFWSKCPRDHCLDTQWSFSVLIFLFLRCHLADGHFSFGNTFFTWPPGH